MGEGYTIAARYKTIKAHFCGNLEKRNLILYKQVKMFCGNEPLSIVSKIFKADLERFIALLFYCDHACYRDSFKTLFSIYF